MAEGWVGEEWLSWIFRDKSGSRTGALCCSLWMNEWMMPLDLHWKLGSATCIPASGPWLSLFTRLEFCSHTSSHGWIPELPTRNSPLHHFTSFSLKHLSLFDIFFSSLLIYLSSVGLMCLRAETLCLCKAKSPGSWQCLAWQELSVIEWMFYIDKSGNWSFVNMMQKSPGGRDIQANNSFHVYDVNQLDRTTFLKIVSIILDCLRDWSMWIFIKQTLRHNI